MAPSPANMVAEIYRHDLVAFIHRSFLELNPAATFEYNWHLEMIAQSLKDVANGNCKRLIINVPPRHLKSHSASIAFPAWFLGHFPEKQVACVSYAQDFSDTLARHSRRLMNSAFYQAFSRRGFPNETPLQTSKPRKEDSATPPRSGVDLQAAVQTLS